MKINLNPNPKPLPDAERDEKIAAGGFGKYYTDNMVTIDWSEANGWSDAQLNAYGPITLDPATTPVPLTYCPITTFGTASNTIEDWPAVPLVDVSVD